MTMPRIGSYPCSPVRRETPLMLWHSSPRAVYRPRHRAVFLEYPYGPAATDPLPQLQWGKWRRREPPRPLRPETRQSAPPVVPAVRASASPAVWPIAIVADLVVVRCPRTESQSPVT